MTPLEVIVAIVSAPTLHRTTASATDTWKEALGNLPWKEAQLELFRLLVLNYKENHPGCTPIRILY
jgi:hypothetical protein